jgi:anti-sigma factor RsiW
MNHDETHVRAHEKAIAEMTAEGYLLGDLSDAEADAFERHYFDCRVCADTIRAGIAMFATGREVAKETPVPEPLLAPLPAPLPFIKRAPQWLSVAASAVLAFFIGTQATLFRHAPALAVMEVADPGGAITGVMRGPEDDKLVIQFAGERPVEVVITNTPPQPQYPAYLLELRDGSGKVLHSVDLTAQQALHDDGVPVLLRALPAGRYFLAILGVRKEGNRTELAGKSIVVQ